MALTVNQAYLSAVGYIKAPSTYANAAEELRMANTINDLIVNSRRWSWGLTAATTIAVSAGTQDYTMDSGDQNKVNAIVEAHLLSGSTELPELMVGSLAFPITVTQKRPFAICLLSETKIRLHPMPDATYTLKWQYTARSIEFSANNANWDIPSAMADVAKQGMIWQVLEYSDDLRAPTAKEMFFGMLKNKQEADERRIGRFA